MGDRSEEASRRGSWNGVNASGLVFAPDDDADPTEITVYPARPVDEVTAWLTVDVDHVVDLGEHA